MSEHLSVSGPVQPLSKVRVLLSAYACEPGKGSEPGVGWNWAQEMAELGYEVHVLTRANNRARIEAARVGSWGPTYHYFDLGPVWLWMKRHLPFGVQIYYWAWQRNVLAFACDLHRSLKFDSVHHLTFGVHRQASYLWRLGIPLVVGPVGGAEVVPAGLLSHLSWRERCIEHLRAAASLALIRSKAVRGMYSHASRIYCKTPETLRALPASVQSRASVQLEIGLGSDQIAEARSGASSTALHVLYVGRFLYWKGMSLGLRAISHAVKDGVDINVTIIGTGPAESSWKKLSKRLGLESRVRWIPWLPQRELIQQYRSADVFLFPSLHDSSGNVVLEAMGQGCPVICIATGGPAEILKRGGGIAIPLPSSEEEAVARLGLALREMSDAEQRMRYGRDALQVASQAKWPDVVRRIWPRLGQ